jgi:hypothetical protein
MLLAGQLVPLLRHRPVGRGAGRRVRGIAGGAVALVDRGSFVQHLEFLPTTKNPAGKTWRGDLTYLLLKAR